MAAAHDIEDLEPISPIEKGVVLSVSRRTDIPAFYMDQFLESMRTGFIEFTTPTVHGAQPHTKRVNFADVSCIVWWSKDYSHWIQKYRENKSLFRQFGHLFNFTLIEDGPTNSGPPRLESGLRTSLQERLAQLEFLAREFGPETVKHRFDPITVYTRNNETFDNLTNILPIYAKLNELRIPTSTLAWCLDYPKVRARMQQFGFGLVNCTHAQKIELLSRIKAVAGNVALVSCCTEDFGGVLGPAACVDGHLLERIYHCRLKSRAHDGGQRVKCNCTKSIDIGMYSQVCNHRCAYCYANGGAPVEE